MMEQGYYNWISEKNITEAQDHLADLVSLKECGHAGALEYFTSKHSLEDAIANLKDQISFYKEEVGFFAKAKEGKIEDIIDFIKLRECAEYEKVSLVHFDNTKVEEQDKRRCVRNHDCTECLKDRIDWSLLVNPFNRECQCEECFTCNYYKEIGKFRPRRKPRGQ